MTEIWFIPTWLGTWADANPNFRNMPVFAVLAALLFFVLRSFQLPTANRVCEPKARPKMTPRQTDRRGDQLILRTLPTALRAAMCASALGALLEALQLLLPGRWADPLDVMWMTLGAFVGAFGFGCFYQAAPCNTKFKRWFQQALIIR